MTVLNTSQGLLVHSPVALDDDLQQKIKQLSVDVAIIVAPNYEHLKFTKAWANAFPNAKVVGCPGVTPRLEGVRVDAELTSSEPPPTFWPAEVKYVVFDDVEVNPFTSKPFFNEVCLVAYDTLITADLFWNYPDSVPWKTRAWKFGMDQVYLPFYRELMVGSARRDALRAKVEQLGEFACIVPCHGDIVTSNGAYVLRTHLNL